MSVRVVARVRPLHSSELERDAILNADPSNGTVRIPNPRNDAESFTFHFNTVFDGKASQKQLFDDEIAPSVKSLFRGLDVVIFAYGVTGTGKTHTMRGSKSLAERGVIPRLLSSIYRRRRKIEKDSAGATTVQVAMSYYEIYCDRVYDLFEPPEKRTPAGLPIRDNGGKTVIVGLTERPCHSLDEFEKLYDHANINRSTSATKLNAHSSRSHAILSVKLTQITGNEVRVSTVSAIDLAGSEDNRRTDNGKERMVESAAINKSLFVLAQCVEAISRKQTRIPYRESRMTRILSLGQNHGITIMILQLAPVRSYHLDTLSSLNFANRTKKIEVSEIENLPFYRESNVKKTYAPSDGVSTVQRQPLRPRTLCDNSTLSSRQPGPTEVSSKPTKAVRSFAVFSDKNRSAPRSHPSGHISTLSAARDHIKSRSAVHAMSLTEKPPNRSEAVVGRKRTLTMTQESIEALVERKVAEKLAESAATSKASLLKDEQHSLDDVHVKARLDALERRVGSHVSEQSEGVQFLLMAKQHEIRHEEHSALKMFELALPFFPDSQKLLARITRLRSRIREMTDEEEIGTPPDASSRAGTCGERGTVGELSRGLDPSDELAAALASHGDSEQTPRTKQVLRIINSRDVGQIRLLKGVGPKKAEAIVNALCSMDDGSARTDPVIVRDLDHLGTLRGIGSKGAEKMRFGIGDDEI